MGCSHTIIPASEGHLFACPGSRIGSRVRWIRDKAELVERKGPWRGLDDLEYATLEWVDWFNHRRLFSAIGYVPPAEYEANLYRGTVPAEAGTQ